MSSISAAISRLRFSGLLAGALSLTGLGAAEAAAPVLALSDPGEQAGAPVVGRRADGAFVTAWVGPQGRIVARRHLADGTRLGAPLTVKPGNDLFPASLRIAVNAGGDFVVSWEQRNSDGRLSIETRSYDRDGQPRGGAQAMDFRNSGSIGSDVAIDEDGDYTVAWREVRRLAIPLLLIPYGSAELGSSQIKARRFSASGTPIGNTAVLALSLTEPAPISGVFDQLPPSVASDAAGHSVIAWSTRDGLGPSAVFARRLDARGRPDGLAFRVDDRSTLGAFGADVAVTDDGRSTLISWTQPHAQDGGGTSGHEVRARRYDAAGRAGPVIAVGDLVAIEERASVAINAAGQAVVAWSASASDFCCFPPLVAAQFLDASGARVGGNQVLTMRFTESVTAGIDGSGAAVVVWSANNSLQPNTFASLVPAP